MNCAQHRYIASLGSPTLSGLRPDERAHYNELAAVHDTAEDLMGRYGWNRAQVDFLAGRGLPADLNGPDRVEFARLGRQQG